MRLCRCLILLLSVSLVGCHAQEQKKAVKPAKLRFDGIYRAQEDRHQGYLRFYPEGVLITSSSETPDEVVRWFNRSYLRLHPYTSEGPWVTIPTKNWEGETTNWRGETLDWHGEIKGDMLRMTRRWTFTSDMVTYVFVPIHGEPGPPPSLKVTEPNPPDGAKGIRIPLLRWQFTRTAESYDVYVGTNPGLGPADRVANRHSLAMFYYAPGLVSGTTYYWRVDAIEAHGAIQTGDVWSFTAE